MEVQKHCWNNGDTADNQGTTEGTNKQISKYGSQRCLRSSMAAYKNCKCRLGADDRRKKENTMSQENTRLHR